MQEFLVVLGAEEIESRGTQNFKIEKVDVHPNFKYRDGLKGYFDIAIIHLASDIKFNDFSIQPICLPYQPFNQDRWYDKTGDITGYSNQNETSLTRTKMTIFSNTMCNGFLNGQLERIEKCELIFFSRSMFSEKFIFISL